MREQITLLSLKASRYLSVSGQWLRRNVFAILDVVKLIGIFVLVLMFIRFSVTVADNTKTAKETTEATNRIVQSQNDILQAIQQLALDTKVTSDQKTNIIICMLQVPVEQRTTDVVNGCRNQVETGVTSPAVRAAQTPAAPAPTPSTQPTQTLVPTPSVIDQILQGLGFKHKIKVKK